MIYLLVATTFASNKSFLHQVALKEDEDHLPSYAIESSPDCEKLGQWRCGRMVRETTCIWDTTDEQCKKHDLRYKGELCAIKHRAEFGKEGYLAIMACETSGYLVALDKEYDFKSAPEPCEGLDTRYFDEDVKKGRTAKRFPILGSAIKDVKKGRTAKRFPILGSAIKACKENGTLSGWKNVFDRELDQAKAQAKAVKAQAKAAKAQAKAAKAH